MSGRETSGRFGFIDGLRAFACLAVFYTHGTEYLAYFKGFPSVFVDAASSIDLGRLGVVVFFAISGFVIPSTMKRDSGRGLAAFVINRFFRLYPAYWLSLLPSAAIGWWMMGKSFPLVDLGWNATMIPDLLGVEMANNAYWTLAVELIFYLLCVVIFIGMSERVAFVYALLGLAGFCTFMSSQPGPLAEILNPHLTPDTFFYSLDLAIMMWGAILRFWWSGRPVDAFSKLFAVGFGAYWAMWEPLKLAIAYVTGDFADVDQRLICGYGGGIAIFIIGMAVVDSGSRGMIWVGRRSYSIYLLHGPVSLLATVCLIRADILPVPAAIVVDAIVAVTLTMLLAHLAFTYVEAPAIALGHRLGGRLAPHLRRTSPATAEPVGPISR